MTFAFTQIHALRSRLCLRAMPAAGASALQLSINGAPAAPPGSPPS
jgi:hypothetical protein